MRCAHVALFFLLPSSRNFRTALLLVRGLYVTRLTKLLGLRFSSASSSLSLSIYLCTAFCSLRHQIKCIYTCAEYLSIYKTPRRRLRLRRASPGLSLKCWCNCANGESFVFVAFLPYGWRRGRAGIFIKKSTERADEQRGGLRFDYIPLCRPLEMRVNWLDARFSSSESESRRGGQKLKRTQLDTIVRQPLRLPPFISPIRLVCVVWETVSNIFPCRRLLESLKCLPMRIAILRWLLFCSKLPSFSSSYITRGMCGEKRTEWIFFLFPTTYVADPALWITFSSVHQPPTKKEKIESKPEWNPGCGTKADAVARNPQSRATIECSKTLPPFSRDPSSSSRWDWRRKSRRIL